MQFRISALLIATAICAALFAVPGGICAAPFLLATLAVYAYEIRRGGAKPATTRLKLGLESALVVVVIANLAGWLALRNDPYRADWNMFYTDRELRSLREQLEGFKQRTGSYPHALAELKSGDFYPRVDTQGRCVDYWQNPIVYHLTPTGYALLSHGRDGLPGGVGFDADLDGVSRLTPPTAKQYLWETDAGIAVPATSMVAGALCLLVFFVGTSRVHREGPVHAQLSYALSMLVIVTLSIVFAVAMGILHSTPSGH
ncbi:MAG: type II secretion system protein GspG [Pirellulales bacterium]